MRLPHPDEAGLFHIVGIGGNGMSAIAEVMHTRGYRVQAVTSRTAPISSACVAMASNP